MLTPRMAVICGLAVAWAASVPSLLSSAETARRDCVPTYDPGHPDADSEGFTCVAEPVIQREAAELEVQRLIDQLDAVGSSRVLIFGFGTRVPTALVLLSPASVLDDTQRSTIQRVTAAFVPSLRAESVTIGILDTF